MAYPTDQLKALDRFRHDFRALTGKWPLKWQERLFENHFLKNDLPSAIDLPTGLGKTMVMAIWLVARSVEGSKLPRRLIYVVDRRTVVDQATELAEEFAFLMAPDDAEKAQEIATSKPTLAERKKEFADALRELRRGLGIADSELAISTLRGQLADNREWSRHPSMPAIIIGTVDLIGSSLLFSGYRSSYKRRPLEAGFLGQDSLLVLDEAHLSTPFEQLLVGKAQDGTQEKKGIEQFQLGQGSPLRVIRMSATSGPASPKSFTLQFGADGNLTGEDASDSIVVNRFSANKRLAIKTVSAKENLNKQMADAAIALAQDPALVGKRIVVFVRSPNDATDIAERIQAHARPSKSKANPEPKGPYASSVEILTGTMRGLERDQLVEKGVFKDRWLNGDLETKDPAKQEPVFLVSTSAGEVGFDLNADHLIGDAAPLDSWIQRLGRVNRRGKGDATVILVLEKEPAHKTDFDKACIATSQLFTDGMDVSPKALAAFRNSLTAEQTAEVCSPKPATVELTDILLDAWSLTSVTERMPGRPEVGPWLRGIDDDQAETTIAWRAELELFEKHPQPEKAFTAIFAKHRVRPHESIRTYSRRVVEFLRDAVKPKGGRPDLLNTRLAIRLPRGEVVTPTVEELVGNPSILYAEPTLILPATFGGLTDAGMLSVDAIPPAPNAGDPPLPSLDVADHPGYERHPDAVPRVRLVLRRNDKRRWVPESLPRGVNISDRLDLEDSYDSSTALFDDLRKRNKQLRIRLVQKVNVDDEDDAICSLVLLAPVANRHRNPDQSLNDHVRYVEEEAQKIAKGLNLEDPVRSALLFAARWHDEGKKADIWQRFVYGPDEAGPKGKSSKTRDPKSLRGYRHEFGSLLRIHRPSGSDCQLPLNPDARDLALHLIATHHGFGRPHFDMAVDHTFRTDECEATHIDGVRRFARLQRKYGWWQLAWLENLLRCADAMASADDVSEDDVGEGNEETGER